MRVKGLEAEQRHARLQLLRELFGLEEADARGGRRRPRRGPLPAPALTALRIGTRGSRLALAQARAVADGDRGRDRARRDHDGRRRRPRARRQVALDRRARGRAAGRRHRPRGALRQGRAGRAGRGHRDRRRAAPRRPVRRARRRARRSPRVREGARVGTSALRRTAQLLAARPDLEVARAARQRRHAAAQARRGRGRRDRARRRRAGRGSAARARPAGALDGELFVPAAGQGVIAVQARAGDARRRCRLRRVPCGHDGVPAGGTGRDPGARRELSRPRRRFGAARRRDVAHARRSRACPTAREWVLDEHAAPAERPRGGRPRARAADAARRRGRRAAPRRGRG